jgi:hypothetical protein
MPEALPGRPQATSTLSMIVGSSSPTPARFTCRAAGHSRSALSVADRSASAPSKPSSQASKSGPRGGAGMRSWYGVVHADPPDTITVQERISSFDAGSSQRSQSPAKARIGEPSAAVNKRGITVTRTKREAELNHCSLPLR